MCTQELLSDTKFFFTEVLIVFIVQKLLTCRSHLLIRISTDIYLTDENIYLTYIY